MLLTTGTRAGVCSFLPSRTCTPHESAASALWCAQTAAEGLLHWTKTGHARTRAHESEAQLTPHSKAAGITAVLTAH